MKITTKTNEDASYRGEPIRKMELALDRAMKKAGFSFMRTTKMGDRLFKKDGKTYSYHIQGQSGDPKYFDYVIVTKGEPGWDKNVVRDHFDDIYKAVTWLNTKTSEKRIAKKYGAKNEGPGAGYFIKLKNVHVDKAWVESSRQYSILKAKFSADWEANHSYWGGEGSADDFEVSIYLSRSLSEFMDWPGAEEEYAQKGSLFDFVKDTCLDDIKSMLNFDCGREGYTYGGGWTTKIPNDGVFEFDNMQFDPDYCTVYQYHDKSYVPVSITSEDMMYGIQDAWDEWSNPPETWVVRYGTDDGDSEKEYFDNEDDAKAFYDDHFGADGIDWMEEPERVDESNEAKGDKEFEKELQTKLDAIKGKYFSEVGKSFSENSFIDDGWKFYAGDARGDIATGFFKKEQDGTEYNFWIEVDTTDGKRKITDTKWWYGDGFSKKVESAPDIEELRNQTISWGTLRSEDLVPKFLNILKTYAPTHYSAYITENPEVLDWKEMKGNELDLLCEELIDLLDMVAPEGTYFGAHPGDGADFGFWSVEESKKSEAKKPEANIEDLRDKVLVSSKNRPKYVKKMLDVLKTYAPEKYDAYVKENPEALDIDNIDLETILWIEKDLFDLMKTIAPKNTVFGVYDHDGFGFWSVSQDESKKVESKKSEGNYQDWASFAYAMYASRLRTLARKLVSFGFDVEDDVNIKDENKNDKSAEYSLYAKKDGKTYEINVDIYEGKHTTITIKADNKVVVQGEGSSFASALSTIDANDIGESKKSEKKDDYALFFETLVPGELTGARMFLTDMWNKMGNKKPRITFESEDPDFDSFVSHPTARVYVCGDTLSIASYAKYLLAHYDEIPQDFKGRWVWKNDLAYFARGFKESLESNKSESVSSMVKKILKDKPEVMLTDDAVNEYDDYDEMLDDFEGEQDYIHIGSNGNNEDMIFRYNADKNLIVVGDLDVDGADADAALSLVQDFVAGKLKLASSGEYDENSDFIAIIDGMTYTEYVYIRGDKDESKKPEGKDDKDCKGKGCDGSDEKCGGDKKSEATEGSDYYVIVFTSNEDAVKGAEYAHNLGEDSLLPPGGKAVYVYGNDRDALKAFGKKWYDICVDDDLGVTSTFGLNKKDETKKSEADEHIEFKQTEFPKELRKLYKACSERFYCEPYVSDMLESSRGGKLPKNEMTCDYTLRGSFGSDVILSVNMVYRGGAGDLTFTVTVSALDETTGHSWERLGDATARSFDDALNAAMSEVDKNLMPFAVKVRKAIKGESKKSESSQHDAYYAKALQAVDRAIKMTHDQFDITGDVAKFDADLKKYLISYVDSLNDTRLANIGLIGDLRDRIKDFARGDREEWWKTRKQGEAKKSESLSLKQKELKDMVRYGEAEDITTISDAEAKELRKKGIELVGVSRGTYGMNGALLRDNEGKKYAITARSSNLFYFV